MAANLDTDLLRAFVAVADARSFTRAAQTLLRTQAAVSQQVKRLEDAVGARVFERDPRGVHLTPDGERLLAYARRLLTLNDEALAAVGRRAGSRPVRIGAPDDYATLLLPPLLARLVAAHPEVPVEVVCDDSADLTPAVERGAVDLALVTRMPGTAGGTALRREPLVWAAPPAAAAERDDPLPLAVFPPGCVCRALSTDALDRAGRRWRVAFASGSILAIHGAVTGGLAVTALEACTVPPDLRVVGPAEGLPALPEVEIALLHGSARPAPPVRCLEDAIIAALGRPAPQSAAS